MPPSHIHSNSWCSSSCFRFITSVITSTHYLHVLLSSPAFLLTPLSLSCYQACPWCESACVAPVSFTTKSGTWLELPWQLLEACCRLGIWTPRCRPPLQCPCRSRPLRDYYLSTRVLGPTRKRTFATPVALPL